MKIDREINLKKIMLLLLSSFILTSCSSEVSFWAYLGGDREKDGLIYRRYPAGDTIEEFTTDLQDDEIIYIPAFFSTYWSGEPRPVIVGGWMRKITSNDLRILFLTGNQTTFERNWHDNLPKLETVVFNTLNPTYLPELFPGTTLERVLEYGYLVVYSHESFGSVVEYYDTLWDSEFGSQDYEPPAGTYSSRISYYYNYDDSPNRGLYRIGIEYELGIDLTPPEDPIRIKKQTVFGTEYYTFLGWSSDGSTFIPYDFASSEEDIEVQLYAYWS